MKNLLKNILILALVMLPLTAFADDEVTVTSYAPAPEGDYQALRTQTLQVTGGTPGVGKVLMSDASGNATWQFIGDDNEPLLARIILSGDSIVSKVKEWQITKNWQLDFKLDPDTTLISKSGSDYGVEVDTTAYGQGNLIIRWRGSVGVDAIADHGVYLLLQARKGTGDWSNKELTELFVEDSLNATIDDEYQTIDIGIPDADGVAGPRNVTFAHKRNKPYQVRLIAKRTGNDTKVQAKVVAGFVIEVYRSS